MKHSILRYLTVLIILSISGFSLNAQNTALVLDASSFKPVQQDAITGVSVDKIEKDRSNRECARIKLHLNRMTPEEVSQVGVFIVVGVHKERPLTELCDRLLCTRGNQNTPCARLD